MPEPIETMTPDEWAALEAAYEAAPLPPYEGTLGITDPYLRLTALARNSLGAILAYHKQAEEIRQAAEKVVGRDWGTSARRLSNVDWISGEERLPEYGALLLVWDSGVYVAQFRAKGWWSSVPGHWNKRPTHWAELPEEPGKGQGK